MPNAKSKIEPGLFRRKLNVMVTGGTGFIGHNVVLDLLEWTDWTFTVVDKRGYASTGRLYADPRYDRDRVTVITHDLETLFERSMTMTKRDLTYLMTEEGKPDIILNIASNSHVDRSIEDPAPFVQENVALMLNMLEYARQAKPKLFLQFSTDEVYGAAPLGRDFVEWDPTLPSNPYAASKAAQEAIAVSYWRTYGVPILITNTMNVIGPGQHPEKFVPMALDKLSKREPVPVHAEYLIDHDHRTCGDCRKNTPGHEIGHWESGSRYYIYVSNVSSALEFLVNRALAEGVPLYPDYDRPEKFHIVGDEEVRNDDMVRRLAELLGVPPLMDYVDFHASRPGHDRRYALDGARLAGVGWEPPVTLDEGLRRVIEDAKPFRHSAGPFTWDPDLERTL